MKYLLTVLLFSALCCAGNPLQSCNTINGASNTISCNLTGVGAHHAVITGFWGANSAGHTYTYSDSAGNAGSGTANCDPGSVCTGSMVYLYAYASGLHTVGLVAASTGTTTGNYTFTVSSDVVMEDLWVGEYAEDLSGGVDAFSSPVVACSLTTTGPNDLFVAQWEDFGGGTPGAAASGFTTEFNHSPTVGPPAKAVADRIDIAPGTYNGAFANANTGPCVALGVAAVVSSLHKGQVY